MNWSCAFDFRICFGKTLIAFNFDENLKPCTSNYVVSRVKRLSSAALCGQVLSIPGYDLENGRMQCKKKSWIKSMAVKPLF